MDGRSFPYDSYLAVKERRDRFLAEWAEGRRPREVPVVFALPAEELNLWGTKCRSRETLLEENLRGLATSALWGGDSVFAALEPWHGVGVYANAFGCEYMWTDFDAPQTLPIFETADEVAGLRKPDPADSEIMNMVLDTIRYFRRETGDRLPICLTDTQSPCDTASLVMATNEFFVVGTFEPERLAPLMNAVTDLIVEFSEIQMEAIGPCLIRPGHNMTSLATWPGISISDDNMAFISPASYEVASLPFNSRLAKAFGSLSIHSCGPISHNAPLQLRTPDLFEVDCHVARRSDPGPNRPEDVRDVYRGTGVLVKVSVDKDDLGALPRLLAPDLKCVVEVWGVTSRVESEVVYQQFKDEIARITSAW